MDSHRPTRRWFAALLTLASLSLIGLQGACDQSPLHLEEETAIAQMLTPDPAKALTLTAWPTPPPILTLPPTATTAPRPLWNASPSPTTLPTAISTATPPAPTSVSAGETGTISPAPAGSKPPGVRLLIPTLDLDVPLEEVSWDVAFDGESWQAEWQTADGAAGHHRNSANPGEAGNVVISGHHNTRGEVFRQVSEIGLPESPLQIGDEILLVAQDGERYTYIIVDWNRFEEEGIPAEGQRDHARYLTPTEDATLTLVTCWPYESNSHRVVVIAKLQP